MSDLITYVFLGATVSNIAYSLFIIFAVLVLSVYHHWGKWLLGLGMFSFLALIGKLVYVYTVGA